MESGAGMGGGRGAIERRERGYQLFKLLQMLFTLQSNQNSSCPAVQLSSCSGGHDAHYLLMRFTQPPTSSLHHVHPWLNPG
jgi:hypothetical protein